MSIPLFFQPVRYVSRLHLKRPVTLVELCEGAGVNCRASGGWVERRIEIASGPETSVAAEPGDWGDVRITLQQSRDKQQTFRVALAIMAYAMHDLVAKESIKGQPWAKIPVPKGRRRTGRALSVGERQRRFRMRAA